MTTTPDKLREHSRMAANRRNSWTPEMETYLRQNYVRLSLTAMEEPLGISAHTIMKKLKSWGVMSKPAPKKGAPRSAEIKEDRAEQSARYETAAMSLHQRRNELLQRRWCA